MGVQGGAEILLLPVHNPTPRKGGDFLKKAAAHGEESSQRQILSQDLWPVGLLEQYIPEGMCPMERGCLRFFLRYLSALCWFRASLTAMQLEF